MTSDIEKTEVIDLFSHQIIRLIFNRFRYIYGYKFTKMSIIEPTSRIEWAEAIHEMLISSYEFSRFNKNDAREIIEKTISYFRNKKSQPPSIAEFLSRYRKIHLQTCRDFMAADDLKNLCVDES